ncbi:MAG TPA: DUF6438 domain-containing protein [Gammaproteobacteria bacterium]|nr:DUF6438 domain-containing protein [Gammaproteobacteria bacterium]
MPIRIDRFHLWLSGALVALLAVVLAAYLYFAHFPGAADRAAVEAARVDIKTFSLFMHRKGCAGDCPTYAVLAKGAGSIEFEGVAFVAAEGSHRAVLDETTARALLTEVLRAGFLDVPDVYTPAREGCSEWRAGGEIVNITVALGERVHGVDYYYGCVTPHAGLEALVTRVDALLGTARWVGTRRD